MSSNIAAFIYHIRYSREQDVPFDMSEETWQFAIEVTDGDLGDRVSLELRGEMAAVFGADSDTGALYLRQLGRMAGGAAYLLLTAS